LNASSADAAPRGRILIISPWATVFALAGPSGVRAGVSDDDRFIDAFQRAGWELHFLRPATTTRDPRVHTHLYPNFFHATRFLPTFLRRLLWPLLFERVAAPRALEVARDIRPDVVLGHSHYAPKTTRRIGRELGIAAVTKLFGVQDLVHTHWPAWKYRFKNAEQLAALKHPQDLWIVLDDGTRGEDVLRGRGIPADRIRMLPNGLDVAWLDRSGDRAAARARYGIPAGARVITYVARLVGNKQPRDFVAAVGRVGCSRDDVVALVIGDGPEREACERIARDANAGGRIRFLGPIPHDDIPALMDASDLFVATGALSNRAVNTCEAMMCGVPVLVYDTGDTRRVVRPGETGVTVANGDVAALAGEMLRLLGDETERRRLANNARALARDTFVSWERRMDMEREIIEALAGRKRGGGDPRGGHQPAPTR
jgi:glycosyltransferase involved in cell wall biosynthesis